MRTGGRSCQDRSPNQADGPQGRGYNNFNAYLNVRAFERSIWETATEQFAALFLQRTDVSDQRFYIGIGQFAFISFHFAFAVLDDVRSFGVWLFA